MDSLIISKFAAKSDASNHHNMIGLEYDDPITTAPYQPIRPGPIIDGPGFDDHITPSPYINGHPLDHVNDLTQPVKATIGFGVDFKSSDGCKDFHGHLSNDNGHGTNITIDGSTSKCDGGHSHTTLSGGVEYHNNNGGFGVHLHGGDNKGADVNFNYQW